MTCLVPPAGSLVAGQPGDANDRQRAVASSSRERSLSLVGAAFQGLLDQWRGLGLDLDVFLPTPEALPRLSAWSARQLELLLQALTALHNDPQACRELARGLRSLALGADAVVAASWNRSLLWLRPLLSLQGLTRPGTAAQLQWPQLPGDPLSIPLEQLGLSIRSLNRLRRNGMTCLVELAGVDAERLLAIGGMGATSVQEIADLLAQQGLALPFTLEEGWSLPPLPVAGVSSQDALLLGCLAADGALTLEIPHRENPAEVRDWTTRAIALLAGEGEELRPERALQALQALTVERFPSLRQRLEDIHQLQHLLRSVASGARLAAVEMHQACLWQEAVQQRLLRRYSELLAAGASTTDWFISLRRHLHRHPHSLHLLLLHLAGRSLTAIGQVQRPPLSSARVRHQIQTLEQLLGLRVEALHRSCQERITRQNSERKATVLRDWIAAHGRLPFHTDDEAPAALQAGSVTKVCQQMRQLSLSRRLALHAELELPVPEAEWELHFRVLVNNEERPGTGYWETLEPLRQLLPRFAVLLGAPGLMPKQTQLPPAVRGAVQQHGGQSRVAEAIGLAYQGQLVGEHGRTYWTEQRLEQLLEQTVTYCRLPPRAMPSRVQIRNFMQSGLVAEYADKRFESVHAALTRQCTLSWPQLAQRFGRV